jgi:hypothetical protein
VEHGEELRQRLLELLMPDGTLVGDSSHRRGHVRTLQGSTEAAEEFFDKFRELGEPLDVANYPGELIALEGEGRVGLRRHSRSGEPTIDVGVQCAPEIRKIKFV